jgi:hypothetical protein
MDGVAYRPAWYHTAYSGRGHFWFVDDDRHARFQALMRDTATLPLIEVTAMASEGRLLLNGEPYTWEADEMVFWLDNERPDEQVLAELMSEYRFTMPSGSQPTENERG